RHLADLLRLIEQGTISGRTAKEILPEVLATGARPDAIVREKGLSQISDTSELEPVIAEVIAENAGAVAEVSAGKTSALTFLVGQVMKKTRGRANPELAHRLLRERLGLDA
ncbi:MAG: Asp-tRNA(Asn)/Glu-tRNA(Gln) amidotransferase subunit GatB, partial [bacterium]